MSDMAEYARGLHVGPKIATQVTAILGQRDSGKTYAGMKLAEIIDDFGVPLIVLDPVGVWWSLTVPGSGPALELLVLGGRQGDLPLETRHACRLARLVVQHGISVVVDLSLMREKDQQRFAADFADELFLASRESRTPRTLIVEEAHKFVPQGRPTDAGERIQDIVRIGRNFGLGVVLISQRPQSIDKEVLTQTTLLMVGRLVHNLDVDAIKKWVEDPLVGVKRLAQGTFYSWQPDKDGVLLHEVLPKRTLDASSTPEVGEVFCRQRSSKFNVEEIRKLLVLDAPTSTETGSGADVAGLKNRIVQLQRELDNRAPTVVTKSVEVPVIPPEYPETIALVQQQLAAIQEDLSRLQTPVSGLTSTAGMTPLPDVLLWVYRLGSLSLGEVGVLLGLRCDTGEFKRRFSELVVRGSLVLHDGRVRAREPAPPDLPPITGDEAIRLVGRWQPSLSRVQGAMLKYVLMAWPIRPSLDDVAAATGYSVRSGGLRDAPRVLRNLNLLEPTCRNRALAPGRVLRPFH